MIDGATGHAVTGVGNVPENVVGLGVGELAHVAQGTDQPVSARTGRRHGRGPLGIVTVPP